MAGPTMERAMLGPPDRWMYCPKTGTIVDDLFFPFKTPLCGLYDSQIEQRLRFHPEDVFNSPLLKGGKIGLWIDLTKTDRFYFKHEVENQGCKYKKICMAGHGSSPSISEINEFIREVDSFVKNNPRKIVAVHCTHGFNRTGFAIISYLVTKKDYAVDYAVQLFASHRPCGIYKQDYLDDIFKRFDVFEDCVEAPPRPSWEFGEDISCQVDINSVPSAHSDTNGNSIDLACTSSNKQFMDGLVPGVEILQDVSLKLMLQGKIREMCGASRDGFPGLQPVSMMKPSTSKQGNIHLLEESPYLVSWKADGMRYMVLIVGQDEVFAFDRDNEVFCLPRLDFPHRKEKRHIKDTLVDAEMVIDKDAASGTSAARLLIYDIISYEGKEGKAVGQMDYNVRRLCIEKELIGPRNEAREQGKLRPQLFSVRIKRFYNLEALPKLLDAKFQQGLGHEMDGLIFQPIKPPYKPGRCESVLKWKDPHYNSVDFLLKIKKEVRHGELPQFWAFLYVQHSTEPLAKMKALRSLQQYDNKIVECNFNMETKEWNVMRVRTDKSLPNAYNTAMNVWESIQNPISEKDLIKYVFTRCIKKRPNPGVSEPTAKKQKLDN